MSFPIKVVLDQLSPWLIICFRLSSFQSVHFSCE